jgi:hypothetical protein
MPPIRGDKTPTNFPPIFYHFPTNLGHLFLCSHTPRRISYLVYIVNCLEIPIFPITQSVGIKPPPTPHQYFTTFSPTLGLYFYTPILLTMSICMGSSLTLSITLKFPYFLYPNPWGQNPHQIPSNILFTSNQFSTFIFIIPYFPPCPRHYFPPVWSSHIHIYHISILSKLLPTAHNSLHLLHHLCPHLLISYIFLIYISPRPQIFNFQKSIWSGWPKIRPCGWGTRTLLIWRSKVHFHLVRLATLHLSHEMPTTTTSVGI